MQCMQWRPVDVLGMEFALSLADLTDRPVLDFRKHSVVAASLVARPFLLFVNMLRR